MAPEAPKGVRVRIGTEWIEIEPLYVGCDDDGQHEWCAPVLSSEPPSEGHVDYLPSQTTLSIEVVQR